MDITPYNKIVIWGLRSQYHTHRYIHKAFYETLQRNNIPSIWVDDTSENSKLIEKNDLVLSSEVVGKMVPEKKELKDYHLPIRDDIFYCLHNYKKIYTEKLLPKQLIHLQVYTNKAILSDLQWGPVTFFDSKNKVLYQPWGTNIPVAKFRKPIFNKHLWVFWIGSVWNNNLNQGNMEAINELKRALKLKSLKFVALRFVPEWLSVLLIRWSRVAPAIAGGFQVNNNYLPCRMFKNISYGQLGFSNVNAFKKIFMEDLVPGNTIEEMVNNVLALSKKDYINLVSRQQEIVKQYTYEKAWQNIFRALKQINQ